MHFLTFSKLSFALLLWEGGARWTPRARQTSVVLKLTTALAKYLIAAEFEQKLVSLLTNKENIIFQ